MDASTNWLLLAFVLLVIALALLVSRSRGAARREMEKVASVLVLGAPASNLSAGARARGGLIGLIEPLVDFDPTSNFDSVAFDADSNSDSALAKAEVDPVDRAYMTAGPRQLARQSVPYRPYSCGRAAFDAEIASLLRALKAADEYLRPDWPAALLPESADLPASDKSAAGAPTPGEVRRAAEVRRRVMHRLRVLPALHAALSDYHAALGCVALTGAISAPFVAPDEAARRRARVAVLNAQTWALEDYRDYVRRGASYLEYEGRESDARRLRCVLRAIDSVM